MRIVPKDDTVFASDSEELNEALDQLTEKDMLEIPVVDSKDMRKWRGAIAQLSRKYNYKTITRYDKDKEILYVSVEDTKLRDISKSIELLSKYPEMVGVIEELKRIRNEIQGRENNINNSEG